MNEPDTKLMTTEFQITRTKDEPGATTIAVEAPVERVKEAERKATAYYSKRVRLPGFRKGKVPGNVIRRRFGDAIKETIIRELVSDSWKVAVDREKLEPIAEPRVHSLKFEDDQPVTFEFLVEVKPALTLERLSGFSVKRTVPPVADAQVQEQLDHLRRENAPLRPIEDERPRRGDHVQVSMATLTEGEAGEPRPYQLEIGSGQALPELEERIMEMAPGQTADVVIKFPEDYADESKRGQTMSVRVTLNGVKRLDLPAADDDFAREVGDFDTIDQLRAAIREDLEKAAEREADAGVRRELLEQITAANQVPAPRPMVERVIRMYGRAYGVPDDQLGKFATEFGPIAEAQVKRDLVLQHVAENEQLRATEDEVDERIERIAKARDQEPGKVYAALQQDDRIKELESSITEEKVFDFLLKQSTVTES